MERIIDAVCGMEIDAANTPFTTEYEGHTFYFCSAQCKAKFDSHPQTYVQNQAEAKTTA